jgi:uncharacterized protein
MKIVMVLAVVLIGIWLFRSNRRAEKRADLHAKGDQKNQAQTPSGLPMDMVRCQHCDLHLPQADSVAGKRGVYCSPEHRQRAES